MTDASDTSLDIPFSVPFVHRLRVTDDVSRENFPELLAVMDAGENSCVKVLVVAEKALSEPTQRIAQRLEQSESIHLVRSPVLVTGGEEIKNSSATVDQILQQINQFDLDRRCYILAIGGGAMLDAVGYAAAVAHRGIRLIRLPTTTLAQADSGVGVKNAINHFEKKNWISFSIMLASY